MIGPQLSPQLGPQLSPQLGRVVNPSTGSMHPALARLWLDAERLCFSVPSTADLFNPYRDAEPDLDVEGAAEIRKQNLAAYFAAFEHPPRLLLLAEAPGPWGCRFSGVPITSEAQLIDPSFPVGGRQSSRRNEPYSEYSAGIFWRLLQPAFPHFFVWNTVPLHPHRRDEPLTIRTPRTDEVIRFEPLTALVIEALAPSEILAVGRKAESTLTRIGAPHTYVRHPSQGGAVAFAEGVTAALARFDQPG